MPGSDTTITNTSGTAALAAVNLSSLDIETALLAVQTKRTELLETQLRDQIAAVQAKNEQIGKLNNVLSALNAMTQFYGTDTNAGFDHSKFDWNDGNATGKMNIDTFRSTYETTLNQAIRESGLTDMGWPGTGYPSIITWDKANNIDVKVSGTGAWSIDLKRNHIEAAVTKLKGQIDSLGNSQQMDTLRLQSLSAKRNEAFEQMTNWLKKMQDVRNNVIGNMR
ncbi:hypothetical protein SDC9_64581 [bioreactor metagenome]|uniref:Uncharacterized protein n=1 Tax=bioreactor metagenome TaxID=1076179 RepID=A0A644XPW8_9ZZZZ